MSRYKFLLPFLPLLLGISALIILPTLIKPEIVLSFRLGLGAVLFVLGLLFTLWMQSLGVADALREKKMRAEMVALTRSYEDSHRRFIRRLDHELKNPLMGLQASLENLQAVNELEERRKAEGNIQKALERLVRLLRDLRKLSDLDENKRLWCINRFFEGSIPNLGLFSANLRFLVGVISQNFAENQL